MRRVRQRGPSNLQWGLITVVILTALVYLSFAKSLPLVGSKYELRATFATANNVKPNSFVRIAGVNVGKVTSVEPVEDGGDAAVVTMEIDEKGLPIHSDATAKVRPRIFLEGNFFIDLQPGSPSAPEIDDGGMLPVNQTSAPVQLDQVLTTLQSDVRKDLQDTLHGLSEGLRGSGAAGYRRSIKYWEPAFRDGAIVSDATLGTEAHDLSGYIKGAQRTAAGLNRDPRALQELLTTFNITAQAFAREDGELRRAIGELPRTLRAAQPALGALNAAFPPLRRLVADARPAVRSSGPALDASLPFVRQLRGLVRESELRGLVRDLRPTVPALARLNRTSVPLQQQVSLASSCQNEVILPWTKDKIEDPTFPARGRVFEEATKPLSGLGGESRSGDANGQWFRVLLGYGNFATDLGTNEVFLSNAPLIGANPPRPEKMIQYRPDVPCETQERPDLRTIPSPAPPSHRIRVPASRQDDYDRVVRRVTKDLNRTLRRTTDGKIRATSKWATKDTINRFLAAARKAKEAGR